MLAVGIWCSGCLQVTLYSNGGVRWKGHAHNSGADGYKFGVSAVLTDGQGHTIAFAHHGHVGGTFTSGSRDYDWNEYHPPHAVIADKLNSFIENGKFGLSTGYSSDIGSAALSALDFTATFLIGGGPVGSGFGLLIFIGALVSIQLPVSQLTCGATACHSRPATRVPKLPVLGASCLSKQASEIRLFAPCRLVLGP